jgi:putative membrane protein
VRGVLRFEKLTLLLVTMLVLLWSGINPRDGITWLFEVVPVFLALAILVPTAKSFPLSSLLYRLLFVHGLILMIGGHYTYAEVPVGYWFQETFELSRNHYDRLGHLVQGFVPAILAREILLRKTPLVPGRWLTFLIIAVCLAFSAFYELIEWWTALLLGESADAVLGMQGDIWDSQWDMFLALLGACVSLATLSKVHDRSLAALEKRFSGELSA